MTDHFLKDASGVLSCPFWSTFLQCGARLPKHTLNYWTVQSVMPGYINQTQKPRRWDRVGESEMGGAVVMLRYVGHQMLNFTLI